MKNDEGVIVVGSLHYDIFLNASHQPTKGEIVVGKNWFPKFGGKGGNQAIAASSCGILTKMVSAVGKRVSQVPSTSPSTVCISSATET